MGVCLGKETQLMSELESDGRFTATETNDWNDMPNRLATAAQKLNSSSSSAVRFSEPRVPVVFILGGPGSGKITHCDRAVQERPGLAHVNMTDLIQQHVVGNGLQDFTQMPAKNLVEVLMMEMKMAVTASCYLISGYPRSMRDVVEYGKKLHRVDRVILLNWHVKILEKQIEFGSQLGDTVLQLARMELKNYAKNVLAVAEYFDQLKKLVVVDGERQPTDVYADFIKTVDTIVKETKVGTKGSKNDGDVGVVAAIPSIIPSNNFPPASVNNSSNAAAAAKDLSRVIWVIGGPGSNKHKLIENSGMRSLREVNLGNELRKAIEGQRDYFSREEVEVVRKCVYNGELVPNELIFKILSTQSLQDSILNGFPRNLDQINQFESRYGIRPLCLLLDCSEVELGRSLGGRLKEKRADDVNSNAVKRRLEIYRTVTLPILKVIDDFKRLFIVDGDQERIEAQREFNNTLRSLVNKHLSVSVTNEDRKPSTDTIQELYREIENNK